jgi:peptidoglycan/xylan/chitin deacetylase (PgdA/CDA1 family)
MRQMKRFLLRVFRLLDRCGVPALFRFGHRHSLTIVLYHGVAPSEEIGIYNYRGKFITPSAFEHHLQYFKKNHVVLPLEDAVRMLDDGSLPDYALAITFDDGYRNFYTHAYPLLQRYNMSATMFLATDFVCRKVPLWVDRLEYATGKQEGTYAEKIALDARTRAALKTIPAAKREHDLRNIEQAVFSPFNNFNDERSVYAPLSREEILELQDAGMSFGAHTKTHPILSTQSQAEQFEEINGSKKDLEALGVRVSPVFAYPNGQAQDWNDTTEALLTQLDFSHAVTTFEGANTAAVPRLRLRRYVLDATEDMAVFANVVSGVRLFLKSLL